VSQFLCAHCPWVRVHPASRDQLVPCPKKIAQIKVSQFLCAHYPYTFCMNSQVGHVFVFSFFVFHVYFLFHVFLIHTTHICLTILAQTKGVAGILNIAEYLIDCVIFPDLDQQTLLSSRFGSTCLLFPCLDLTGFHFRRFGSNFPDLDLRHFYFFRFGSDPILCFPIWI